MRFREEGAAGGAEGRDGARGGGGGGGGGGALGILATGMFLLLPRDEAADRYGVPVSIAMSLSRRRRRSYAQSSNRARTES